jgi:hypothetical protein
MREQSDTRVAVAVLTGAPVSALPDSGYIVNSGLAGDCRRKNRAIARRRASGPRDFPEDGEATDAIGDVRA